MSVKLEYSDSSLREEWLIGRNLSVSGVQALGKNPILGCCQYSPLGYRQTTFFPLSFSLCNPPSRLACSLVPVQVSTRPGNGREREIGDMLF